LQLRVAANDHGAPQVPHPDEHATKFGSRPGLVARVGGRDGGGEWQAWKVRETREGAMTTAADLVAAAKSQIENLSPDEVEAEIASGDAVLVDIREADELAGGRIPGAIHVPRGMLEFRADPSSPYHQEPLDPTKRVILHCASGGRSALSAAALKQLGYSQIAHLDGGMNAWKDAGKAIE
jgi:rhodanese-related sulfurtransferase